MRGNSHNHMIWWIRDFTEWCIEQRVLNTKKIFLLQSDGFLNFIHHAFKVFVAGEKNIVTRKRFFTLTIEYYIDTFESYYQ